MTSIPRRAGRFYGTTDIEVISLDWRWLFIYPHEGIASLNRLVVPAECRFDFA